MTRHAATPITPYVLVNASWRRVSFIAVFILAVFAATHLWPAASVAAWALLVAASRAAMGRHYVGDVTAGLLLGLGTTATVFKVQASAPHDTMHDNVML